MKFLKASIIILFILSFSSAALSLYLSNIRENEKEKRIYLEGVKVDLEGRVGKLESDKAQLADNVQKLESDNQQLTEQLKQERTAREEALALISQKDSDLEALRSEAQQAQFAFQDAQKRNQELERILDELEVRMRQIEGQGQLPGSEVGYIEINPVTPPADSTQPEQKEAIKPEASDITFKPLTTLPEPPKKRKLFPFLGVSEEKKSGASNTQMDSIPKTAEPPVVSAASLQAPVEPVQIKTSEVKPLGKTDQAIAAGNVLLVNRKYNFVVINLGSRQSLGLDDTVSIQQGGKEIAKARVEKIYDDYSAAYIVEEQTEYPITEGDSVTRA